MKSIEAWALEYLARGWSVIPVRLRDKRPTIRWAEYQHRRPNEEDVRRWFHRREDLNIGIVTGERSGLVVMDVDPGHGGDDSLERIEALYGRLPSTVQAITGGGGRHIYFGHPGGVVRNKVAILPGVDLRGDGGYVVAPPSLHVSGKRYVWEKGRAPGEVEIASIPSWLMDLVRTGAGRAGHPHSHWRRLVREGVPEGERNDAIASFAGHLLWHGVDPEITLELLLCWNAYRCSPPLPDEEVARTVQSITRLHERDS
jgi:hypothetical protein